MRLRTVTLGKGLHPLASIVASFHVAMFSGRGVPLQSHSMVSRHVSAARCAVTFSLVLLPYAILRAICRNISAVSYLHKVQFLRLIPAFNSAMRYNSLAFSNDSSRNMLKEAVCLKRISIISMHLSSKLK